MNCNPVNFNGPIQYESPPEAKPIDHSPEAYKSCFKAIEALANHTGKKFVFSFGGTKYKLRNKRWKVEVMEQEFVHYEPMEAILAAVKFVSRAFGIDINESLTDKTT